MKVANGKLSQAIDRVNAAHFWGFALSKAERASLAESIVAHHGKPGAYANTFAISDREKQSGILLFTGERTVSASARHISGEEACRALRLLGVKDRAVARAVDDATSELLKCLYRGEAATDARMGGNPGIYCCGRCSVSVWRHILAGGFDRRELRLRSGVRRLQEFRDGKGRWAVFPFWYTLSALAEMDVPETRAEIQYAAAILERMANRRSPKDEYERRRSEIARRALAKC